MDNSSPFKTVFIFGDWLFLNIAILISALLKFNNGIQYHNDQYPTLFVVFNILWLLVYSGLRPYNVRRITRISARVQKVLLAGAIHGLLIAGFWVVTKAYYYSREFLFFTYLFWFVFIILFHVIISLYERKQYRKGRLQKNVIILGYGELSQELELFFKTLPEYGFKLLGYFDSATNNAKVIGDLDSAFTYCKSNKVEEIYCCIPYLDTEYVRKVVDFGDQNFIKIKLIADYRGFSSRGVDLQHYDQIPVLNIKYVPLDSPGNRFVKRLFDIVFSGLVILLVFPWLYPLIAIGIKLSSNGPVLFQQNRTGKQNYDFNCYKFRTMRINSEADIKQATKGDDRITKFGQFLRKSSIDEIPQFINVLLGDMSVVGPRPHPMNLNKQFEFRIEKFMARHFVKPGITGLAQAKGYRGPTLKLYQMRHRIRLDLFYIENWSLWLDIKIIGMTVISMLKGDENAF